MKAPPRCGDILPFLQPPGPAPRRQLGEVVHVAGPCVVVRNVSALDRIHVCTRSGTRWHSAVASEPSSLLASIGVAVLIGQGIR